MGRVRNKSEKRLEFKIERTIPASMFEAFDAWLDHNTQGTVWNAAEEFILDAKVDGFFYWLLKDTAHYGRFTKVKRPSLIEHTWVSPNTLGEETKVAVTFKKKGKETLMTVTHSELPNCEPAKGHEGGWNYFMEIFKDQFGQGSRKKYDWNKAHPPKKK